MNFELNEAQLALREMYRDFTDREIRPRAKKMDETGELDEELWSKMAELGSFGIVTPEEYGGCGMTFTDLVLVKEEVVKGSGTMYHWIGTSNGPNTYDVLKYGTTEQKRRYVPSIASGAARGAFAMTEPGAGSDASGLKTRAVLTGDHFVINGTKTFCSMASKADRIITIARTSVGGEDAGMSAIMVPTDAAGLSISEEHKMGMRGTPLNEVAYQDVTVPAENLLGSIGQGMEIAMDELNETRTSCGAMAVGLAQEAIDLAVDYARTRMQFGRRISQFQNTQFVLAECQTKVNAARLLVYQAAAAIDKGVSDRSMPSMAKYYSGEVCNDVVRKCLQVFGGYGYCKDYPIERIYRDAKVIELFDGTTEIHKIILSKAMGVR